MGPGLTAPPPPVSGIGQTGRVASGGAPWAHVLVHVRLPHDAWLGPLDPLLCAQTVNRHAAGITPEVPCYKPIRDFVEEFQPTKGCKAYILEDCATSLEKWKPHSAAFFPQLVAEAEKITSSLLQFREAPGGNPMFAFAIVCYTLDVKQFGAKGSENFFELINKMLQERDPVLLDGSMGYLHYLFGGLRSLPKAPQREYFRGIPKAALGIFKEHYTLGRVVHWSGLTSVSGSIAVARKFAGLGGILVRVTAFTARAIRDWSAFAYEDELLLFPNFEAMVCKELHFVDTANQWELHLVEKKTHESKFVF